MSENKTIYNISIDKDSFECVVNEKQDKTEKTTREDLKLLMMGYAIILEDVKEIASQRNLNEQEYEYLLKIYQEEMRLITNNDHYMLDKLISNYNTVILESKKNLNYIFIANTGATVAVLSYLSNVKNTNKSTELFLVFSIFSLLVE